MNLNNNKITVGELLDDPKARAVFQRRFGKWMKHPMVAASRSLTLNQLMEMAGVWLPKKTIQETWQELSRLERMKCRRMHKLSPDTKERTAYARIYP